MRDCLQVVNCDSTAHHPSSPVRCPLSDGEPRQHCTLPPPAPSQMVNRGSTAAGEEMDKLDRRELLSMLKFGADR